MQQDMYGQAPVMDTSGRSMAQNALNQQGSQLGQQALGINKNPMSMVDPIKLGMALRKTLPQGSDPMGTLAARADMAMNSQASPMLQDQVSQLGSSTANPLSNYNLGTNGWGNYGE
jgi:hypothetical protein